jgi:hypothetical protein
MHAYNHLLLVANTVRLFAVLDQDVPLMPSTVVGRRTDLNRYTSVLK